jgi:hypothetical protein
MKKTVVILASMFALLLSACSQLPGFGSTPAAGPTLDATSVFGTAVAKTLTAQPTLPSVSVTDTATPPVMPADTETPFATWTPFATFTLPPNLTTTPASATGPVNTAAAATSTPTLVPGQVTASPTNGILKYGTQPPQVAFNRITLSNRAKAEAYISLQVTMPDGKFSILEYPVQGTFKIEAPVGYYVYVAWVGGRKMVGKFMLTSKDEILITLYKNRVVIK